MRLPKLRRTLVSWLVVPIVGMVALTATTPAMAADEGHWLGGCVDGAACFWEGAFQNSTDMFSAYRDSDFTNDYWPDGTNLNDHATWWQNTFSTLNVAAYQDINYQRLSFCLQPFWDAGPYPWGNPNSLSSFKSC